MVGWVFPRASERDAFGQGLISCFAGPVWAGAGNGTFIPLFDPSRYIKYLYFS